jgi:hypothetical protein
MKKTLWMLIALCAMAGHGWAEDGHEHAKEAPQAAGKETAHEEGEHAEEEVSTNVGPGKAVIAADEHNGIQLSEKAKATLEIAVTPLRRESPYRLSVTALVQTKEHAGVYRQREGWFKFIEGKMSRLDEKTVLFTPESMAELKPTDSVVIRGVPLLRVADLEAFGGSGEGHGH